jgi:hypothetical protein
MPKPKQATERKVHCEIEVEAEQLAPLIAHLSKLGVRTLHYELIAGPAGEASMAASLRR